MIQDFGEEFRTNINMMKDPNSIEYIGIEFNDFYLLDESASSRNGEELTKDNIIDYINKTAKFMMTKTVLRKDVEITGKSYEDYKKIVNKGEKITSLLIQGIPQTIRQEFERNNFCPYVINSYINTPKMSLEIIEKLIEKFAVTMITTNRRFWDNHQLVYATKLFQNYILQNKLKLNPTQDSHFNFITKLLRFWTGSSFYNENTPYRIQIAEHLGSNHLPEAHTCFFRIDIPDYTEKGESYDEYDTITKEDRMIIARKMFDKINTAISNVETGIGIAGGSSKLRRFRNTRR
jgi:hypothetical protein